VHHRNHPTHPWLQAQAWQLAALTHQQPIVVFYGLQQLYTADILPVAAGSDVQLCSLQRLLASCRITQVLGAPGVFACARSRLLLQSLKTQAPGCWTVAPGLSKTVMHMQAGACAACSAVLTVPSDTHTSLWVRRVTGPQNPRIQQQQTPVPTNTHTAAPA
jgi:hypothetical protein